MLRPSRLALATPMLLAAFAGLTGAAKADGSFSHGDTTCTGAGCGLSAVSSIAQGGLPAQGAVPASTGGKGSTSKCTAVPDGGLITADDGTKGYLYMVDCGRGVDQGMANPPLRPLFAPAGTAGPAAVAVDPQVVARQAYAQLSLRKPVLALSPSSFQVVGVPTWLWVDGGGWVPQSATVSVPGVTVTATATPVSVSWDLGEGGQAVLCRGPGTPFTSRSDPAAASPDCGYLYRQPSTGRPGGTFTVRATMHWQVAWQARGAAGQGAFPDLTSQSSVRVQVREVQALVVHDGAR